MVDGCRAESSYEPAASCHREVTPALETPLLIFPSEINFRYHAFWHLLNQWLMSWTALWHMRFLSARKPCSLSVFTATADTWAKQILKSGARVSALRPVAQRSFETRRLILFIPLKGCCMFSLLLSVVSRTTCNCNKKPWNRAAPGWIELMKVSELLWLKPAYLQRNPVRNVLSPILFNLSFYRSKS